MNWKIVICVFVCLVYSSKMALAGYCSQTYTCTTICSSQYNTKEDCGWWIFNSWVKCTKQRTMYGMCTDTCYKQACCHGYGGDDCSRPICHGSEHCRNGGTCMAPDECSCTTGFSPPLCDDINECQYNNGGCSQVCTNTYGSFRCSCRPGFKLGSDGKSCIDVNECQHNNGGCSQDCTNTRGSFRCSCGPNFKLGSDGKSCFEVDDCTSSPCQHNGTCIDRVNSFICICDPGYTDQQCETDIDECVEKNGGCEDICKNTNGSYECSCEGDKHLDENGFSCIRDDDKVHSIIFWIVVLIASAVIFICTMVLAYRIFIRQREKTEIKLKLVTNPENDDLGCEENNGLIIWDTTVGTKKFGSYYDEQ